MKYLNDCVTPEFDIVKQAESDSFHTMKYPRYKKG
jgi:hypothetical protein